MFWSWRCRPVPEVARGQTGEQRMERSRGGRSVCARGPHSNECGYGGLRQPHGLRSGGIERPPRCDAAGEDVAGFAFDVVALETDGAGVADGAERAQKAPRS